MYIALGYGILTHPLTIILPFQMTIQTLLSIRFISQPSYHLVVWPFIRGGLVLQVDILLENIRDDRICVPA